MPTTRPRPSTSAPPELPGFSAASVWMTSSITRRVSPSPTGSERPSADTTPAVTEPAKPCGLPIATTSWPTRSPAASPSSTGASVARSVRSSARSVSGSDPTSSAVSSRPSVKEATTRGALRSPTTCALVSTKPSGVMTTPEPPPRRPTRRLATDGASDSATYVITLE